MPQTTSYAYDLHGNVVLKTMPNGETIAQSFDTLNRVATIEGQKPSSGGLLYRYTQRYALSGDVVHIREDYQTSPAKWREITQSYDGAHRLVEEEFRYSEGGILGSAAGDRDVVYTYDDADNRTAKEIHYLFPDREEYSYNNLNQLTQLIVSQAERSAQTASSREVDYDYDLNGNRLSRADAAGVTGYDYDYENRLVKVTDPTLTPVYTYTYDYRTRRVAIAATPVGETASTTTLSFSGGVSVQEYVDSTLEVEFIRGSDMGGGIGGLLYSLRDGESSFTHYNNRGDVVAKTDTASTLTFQAAYEAYGKRSEETGSTLDPQKANTKDEDPTGLLNEGFRYRDLETGEFITRDPAGFIDGPNLYTYVRQNPWTKFDPDGFEGVSTMSRGSLTQVTFTVPVRFTGDLATPERVEHYKAVIEREWSGQKGRINVTYKIVDAKPGEKANIVHVVDNPNALEYSTSAYDWDLPIQRPDETATHMAGHFIKLGDPYDTETKEQKVQRDLERDIMMHAWPGYHPTERNIIEAIKAHIRQQENDTNLENSRRKEQADAKAREAALEKAREEAEAKGSGEGDSQPAQVMKYKKHYARGSPKFLQPDPPKKKKHD